MSERIFDVDMSLNAESRPSNTTSNEAWEQQFWNPRTLAHMREEYTGKVNGWGVRYFYEFAKTPYQIKIPVKRPGTKQERPELFDEMNKLTTEQLKTEPFQEYYRHVDMLITFDQKDRMREMLHTVLDRSKADGKAFAKAAYPTSSRAQKVIERFINFRTLCYLETAAEDPDFRLSQTRVQQLFADGIETFSGFLGYAQEFDKRNAMHGEAIDVHGRIKQAVVPILVSDKPEEREKARDFLALADPELVSGILPYSLLRADSPEQIFHIIQTFAPRIGVDGVRKKLREYTIDNPAFTPIFLTVFNYLGLDPGKEIAVDVGRDVYGKTSIDFTKDYEPYNELQPFEVDLLNLEFQDMQRVLDIGCGTGRLLEALQKKSGIDVAGFDISEDDIATLKAKKPEMNEADLQVGSWFAIPFPERSFDAAYCLGRSITHNTTVPDFVRCLREMRRVIKDDGFVIIDLPDPDVGEYKKNIAQSKQIAEERKFKPFLPGTIIDSPDQQHYFDRYIPDDDAFYALAVFAGFHPEKIPLAPTYTGASGEENVNTYWKLTKSRLPLPSYLKVHLYLEKIYGVPLGEDVDIM